MVIDEKENRNHSQSQMCRFRTAVSQRLLTLLLLFKFFFFTSSSALLISSSVTPWVERRVSRTRLACAFRCVSLSSSRAGGTKDLINGRQVMLQNSNTIINLEWKQYLDIHEWWWIIQICERCNGFWKAKFYVQFAKRLQFQTVRISNIGQQFCKSLIFG